MSVMYQEKHHVFAIQTQNTTYAFAVNADRQLVHLYWGKRLESLDELESLEGLLDVKATGDSVYRTLNNMQQEYHSGEFHNYQEKALDVEFADGTRGAQLTYIDHAVSEDGNMLQVFLKDAYYPLEVTLTYKTYPGLDLITRCAEICNRVDDPVILHKAQSATLHLERGVPHRLTWFSGNWGAEYQRTEQMLATCRTVIQNNHGNTSGPHAVPFVMMDPYGQATELAGDVYFATLHWSGNFKITCESDAIGRSAVSLGIHDEGTSMELAPGEHYCTPEATIGFSTEGFAGIRKQIYDYQMDYLLPRRCANKPFPILYNSWYPYMFDIDEDKIRFLMQRAAAIGVELFVIDDGWMPGRDCDRKGLGDWVACPDRFPNGLKPLSDEAHRLGMKFGLWVEPEMVNPDSDLFRAHPDWVLQSKHREPSLSRNQLALNMAREDVLQYMIGVLDGLVEDYHLDYLKWDMNRYISDFGWPEGTKQDRDRLPITLIENVYRIWEHLNEKYPDLLLENCAHGGARADFGMQKYTDRINRSDNAHPTDVLRLHEGFSDLMVPKLAGGAGNLSANPYIPYAMRESLSFTGSLSIGYNLLKCSEEELERLHKSIAQFRIERDDLQNSYVYHLMSDRTSPYTVWQYLRRDRKVFTVFGFSYGRHYPDFRLHRMRMAGLIPDAIYECVSDGQHPEEVGKRYTGRALMQIGFELPIESNLGSVRRVFHVVEE